MRSIANNKTRSSRSLVQRLPLIAIGVAFIIFDFKLYELLQAKKVESKTKTPTATTVTKTVAKRLAITTVSSLGRLEPKGEIIEISASSGAEGSSLQELLVQSGSEVEAGDIIAILDSRDRLEAALERSQQQVGIAEANLAKVKAGAKTGEIQAQKAAIARLKIERNNNIAAQKATLSRLKAELDNAKIENRRYQQLFRDGATSASEKDSHYLNLRSAQQDVVEAKANLKRIESSQRKQIVEAQANLARIAEVRPVDIAVVEAEIREAQAAVKTAQAELNRAYIKSPRGGTAIEILTHPGEAISNNEGIVKIGQIDEMYAVAEVYESDVAKVKLGQQATITSSALGNPLKGTVDHIGLEIERQEVVNTDPTANIDAKVVEVKVKLDEASSKRVAGLTNLLVNVEIDLSKQQVADDRSS